MPDKLTPDEVSKDKYFRELAAIADRMVAEHGKDFAMGAMVLAARFLAENKPLTREKMNS